MKKQAKTNENSFLHKMAGSFKTRSFRVGGYSVISFLIILAIIVAANILINSVPKQYTEIDITSKQLFKLSEQTEAVVKKLDRDVTLYWVVNEGSEDTTLETLLGRYRSLSEHIILKKVNTNEHLGLVKSYTGNATIYNNSVIVVCGDESRYLDYYNYIYYYDSTYYNYTGSYQVYFKAESSITSALNYMMSEKKSLMYALTGHGETPLSLGLLSAVQAQNIEVKEINLLNYEDIPSDADSVLINAPQSDLSLDEIRMLRDYMADGGDVILITDPSSNETVFLNLDRFTGYFGLKSVEGVIVEGNPNYYAFQRPIYILPDIASHEITDPILNARYAVMLYSGQGIEIEYEKVPKSVSLGSLLKTSPDAYSKVKGYQMNSYEKEEGDIDGEFILAIEAVETRDDIRSRLIWIGSSSIENQELSGYVSGGNEDFFVNTVAYTCDAEDAISIHAKYLGAEYLTITSANAMLLIVLIVFVLPLGFLVAGIIVWMIRRKR